MRLWSTNTSSFSAGKCSLFSIFMVRLHTIRERLVLLTFEKSAAVHSSGASFDCTSCPHSRAQRHSTPCTTGDCLGNGHIKVCPPLSWFEPQRKVNAQRRLDNLISSMLKLAYENWLLVQDTLRRRPCGWSPSSNSLPSKMMDLTASLGHRQDT